MLEVILFDELKQGTHPEIVVNSQVGREAFLEAVS
jgi:hypothetical protein